jgi:hypothetical protein
MNVSSVNFNQMLQMSSVGSNSSSSTLSESQKALIEETLAQYDADNLSEDDAAAIVAVFEEAGISPSRALESAMLDSGFDAKEVGTLAGVGPAQGGGGKGPMGPPPQPSEEELSTIEALLESLLSSDDEEDESTITAVSSFESILDYTNKIVRLNDDAKAEVMDILNKYSSEDNTLSQADTQAYIINSLKQVLSESDNFNSFSFYA